MELDKRLDILEEHIAMLEQVAERMAHTLDRLTKTAEAHQRILAQLSSQEPPPESDDKSRYN